MNNNIVLISKFITVDHGKYIVQVRAKQYKTTLGTAFGAGDTVELAEDSARERVLKFIKISTLAKVQSPPLNLAPDNSLQTPEKKSNLKPTPTFSQDISTPPQPPSELTHDFLLSDENLVNNQEEIKDNQDQLSITSLPTKKEDILENINYENEILTENSLDDYFKNNQEFENNIIIKETDNLNDNINLPLSYPEPEETPPITNTEPIDLSDAVDFSQVIDQTTIELKRLGWTQEQGKKYLLETYGKKSRHLLSDQELIEFLTYLQTQ